MYIYIYIYNVDWTNTNAAKLIFSQHDIFLYLSVLRFFVKSGSSSPSTRHLPESGVAKQGSRGPTLFSATRKAHGGPQEGPQRDGPRRLCGCLSRSKVGEPVESGGGGREHV